MGALPRAAAARGGVVVKVIMETGAFPPGGEGLRRAADLVAGQNRSGDFLKTSTGKIQKFELRKQAGSATAIDV